jgi:hypothetical protein
MLSRRKKRASQRDRGRSDVRWPAHQPVSGVSSRSTGGAGPCGEHTTYCPYKGDASYYSISVGGDRSVNAVWTYETPFEAMAQIKDYVAFYPEHVDAIQVDSGSKP